MTDNEIIKALECCSSENGKDDCLTCPNFKDFADCKEDLSAIALDLINRKDAEIEKLNVELAGTRGACESYKIHYDIAQAEIERLESEYPCKVKCGNNCEIWAKTLKDYDNLIGDISAEGIKEFAEKVETALDERVSEKIRERNPHWYIAKRIVRETAIEMTEVKNNG